MIRLEDRRSLAREIEYARAAGARLDRACAVAGITARTLQRWQVDDGLVTGDRRPAAPRPIPAHALSPEERSAVLQVANDPRFADLPPARIVPMLADDDRRPVVLPVPDPGLVQPQGRRLGGARRRRQRPCRAPGAPHGAGRGHR
jgi:hypothetical protein